MVDGSFYSMMGNAMLFGTHFRLFSGLLARYKHDFERSSTICFLSLLRDAKKLKSSGASDFDDKKNAKTQKFVDKNKLKQV